MVPAVASGQFNPARPEQDPMHQKRHRADDSGRRRSNVTDHFRNQNSEKTRGRRNQPSTGPRTSDRGCVM
jgi:hypothetical protein